MALVSQSYVNSNYKLKPGQSGGSSSTLIVDCNWIETNYWASCSNYSSSRCPDASEITEIPVYSYYLEEYQCDGGFCGTYYGAWYGFSLSPISEGSWAYYAPRSNVLYCSTSTTYSNTHTSLGSLSFPHGSCDGACSA